MLSRLHALAGDYILWYLHRGIKGNKIADRLAKLATRQNPTGLERLAKKHQKDWFKVTSCKQAKTLIGEHLNFNRAVDMRKLSRTEVKTLTEVFIGHGNLTYHRHKIGLAKSPLCRLCSEDNETSTHIWYYAIVQR